MAKAKEKKESFSGYIRRRKAEKAAKQDKPADEQKAAKEAKRQKKIAELHALVDRVEGKARRTRKYETVKVKVPYDRQVLNFTTAELLDLFGGWFTLTYAFSKPVRADMLNADGTPVMRDYYICSRDVSAMRASERPKKNAVIKKLFDKDVYGYAIVAPASAFGGKDEFEQEEQEEQENEKAI